MIIELTITGASCSALITVSITETQADKIFQECALVQSKATLVVLRLEPIIVLSVITDWSKNKRTFLNKFQLPVILFVTYSYKPKWDNAIVDFLSWNNLCNEVQWTTVLYFGCLFLFVICLFLCLSVDCLFLLLLLLFLLLPMVCWSYFRFRVNLWESANAKGWVFVLLLLLLFLLFAMLCWSYFRSWVNLWESTNARGWVWRNSEYFPWKIWQKESSPWFIRYD